MRAKQLGLSLLLLLAVAGCSNTTTKLVGKWEGSIGDSEIAGDTPEFVLEMMKNMKVRLDLGADGKCSLAMGPLSKDGTWSASGNMLTLNLGGEDGKPVPIVFEGSDKFKMTKDGKAFTFARSK